MAKERCGDRLGGSDLGGEAMWVPYGEMVRL